MGLFSKILDAGKTLIENPNAVDGMLEQVSNLKQNTDRLAYVINEKQNQRAIEGVTKLKGKLKEFETKFEQNYLRSKGKNFENNMIYEKERIINFTYSVPCKYDFLFRTEGYYAAQIDDKFGLINNKDEDIIKFKYDYLECSSNKLILFNNGENYGYMNFDEEVVIEPQFVDAGVYIDGIAYAAINTDAGIKYGYIDTSGHFIIDPQYDYAENFSCNGLVVVGKIDGYGTLLKGVINRDGKLIVACKHAVVKIHQTEIEYATESWHNPSFCDLSGCPNGHEEEYGYDSDTPVPLNVIIPYNTSQLKYGFYTHTSEGDFCNIEAIFDEVSSFDIDGYALVKKDGLYGIISLNK